MEMSEPFENEVSCPPWPGLAMGLWPQCKRDKIRKSFPLQPVSWPLHGRTDSVSGELSAGTRGAALGPEDEQKLFSGCG